MPFDRATMTALVAESVTAPRTAFRRVLSVGGGYGVALPALGLVAVLSAIVSALLSLLTPPMGTPEMDLLLAQPIRLAVLQMIGIALVAALITGLGRLFGGIGRFDQAILILAWFEFLMIALQLVLIVILLVAPPLGGVLMLVAGLLALWIFANATAELHGFKSALATLSALLGVVLLIGLTLTLILPPL